MDKDRIISRMFFFIAIYIFIIVGILAYHQYSQYKEGADVYSSIAKDVITITADDFVVDWEKLKGTGTVGWIRFANEPVTINYPIEQAHDNSYYLHRLYNGEYNICGSIFMNCENNPYFGDANTLLYGHNMRNGSMFHDLRYYSDKSYWEKNKIFYIYLPDGTRHTYEIFASENVTDAGPAYQYSFETQESFQEYLEQRISNSLIDTGIHPTAADRIVTLSTCAAVGSKAGKRIIVQGVERKIEQVQDPASWYNVQFEKDPHE